MVQRIQMQLPPAFYWDHVSRDLPAGEVVRETRTYVEVKLTKSELAELLSDAKFYVSDGKYMGSEYRGLVASAKATVRRIESALADQAAGTHQSLPPFGRLPEIPITNGPADGAWYPTWTKPIPYDPA